MLSDHDVRVLDLNTESDPWVELERTVKELKPEIVGLSLRNIDNVIRTDLISFYEDFEMTVQKIRQISPKTKIIAGGAGFSMFAREIMVRNPDIDFGIVQEGEESLPELLRKLGSPEKVKGIFYRHNDEILFGGDRDMPEFKSLPFPRWELFDLSKYSNSQKAYRHGLHYSFSMGVQSKRGCSLKCSYCNYPSLSGNKPRLRSAMSVVDEIQELKERFKIDSFSFVDSVFNAPLWHAEEICAEIIKRDLHVKWSAYYDIRFVNERFLVLANQAGCKNFEFSPDAYSKAALVALRKEISPTNIKETVMLFKNNADLRECNAAFYFFVSPPGETLIGLIRTIFFIRKINRMVKNCRASVGWIKVLPGTEIYEIALRKNILRPDMPLLHEDLSDLEKLFYVDPALRKYDVLTRKIQRALRI
jgi:radical SAM superfamily enzyme YgiQ (UPF0313 family)